MYDVIIIGGGPAGLTAGLYTSRARLKSLLIEKAFPGGQVMTTEWVENYPGFEDGISGAELSQKMEKAASKYNFEEAASLRDQIVSLGSISIPDKHFKVGDQIEELRSVLNLKNLPAIIEGFDISGGQ